MGAGWATWGRQSPIVLSTAHRFIQEPRVKCTAGSRVDSAFNSFGIAGRATEATGRGLGHPWGRGHVGAEPLLITLIHTKRNLIFFFKTLKTRQALGV